VQRSPLARFGSWHPDSDRRKSSQESAAANVNAKRSVKAQLTTATTTTGTTTITATERTSKNVIVLFLTKSYP